MTLIEGVTLSIGSLSVNSVHRTGSRDLSLPSMNDYFVHIQLLPCGRTRHIVCGMEDCKTWSLPD